MQTLELVGKILLQYLLKATWGMHYSTKVAKQTQTQHSTQMLNFLPRLRFLKPLLLSALNWECPP